MFRWLPVYGLCRCHKDVFPCPYAARSERSQDVVGVVVCTLGPVYTEYSARRSIDRLVFPDDGGGRTCAGRERKHRVSSAVVSVKRRANVGHPDVF